MEQFALLGLPAAAFLLLAGGAFATRPRGAGIPCYVRRTRGRIVGQQRTQIEDVNVRFRRPKQPVAEVSPGSVTLFRSEGSPLNADSPRPELPPQRPSLETPAPQPVAPDQPPAAAAPVVNFPLRSQVTGSDSRADRLLRQVRGEVEALKKTFDEIALDRDEMLELDLDALMADPEHALTLPPAVLVRALVEAGQESQRLRKRASRQREKVAKLTRALRDLEREDAGRRARIETFEDVLAALHANLEDLRYERDQVRLGTPAAPQALRPGGSQLPQASAGLGGRD